MGTETKARKNTDHFKTPTGGLRKNPSAPQPASAAAGITAHAMQSVAIKGFIVHDRESGAHALTDSGRAALLAILGDAGLT
jgi:hypothetical protein